MKKSPGHAFRGSHGLVGALAFSGLCLVAPLLFAQTPPPPAAAPSVSAPAIAAAEAATAPPSSALDSELFYELLVGEITTQDGEAAAGYALILDAARKTKDPQLFQRATEIALQSRSGDAALQSAQAWRQAQPDSLDANRYVLQILVALNRISASGAALKSGIDLAPPAERSAVIAGIPGVYARVTDKKLATEVVETTLAPYLANPATAAAAWTTVGRMRLASGNTAGAMDAAKKGRASDAKAEGPVIVALELMDPKLPDAEALIQQYLAGSEPVSADIRMGYARALLDTQRYAEATAQLQKVLKDKPDYPAAWLVLGSLQLQDNQLQPAQVSLERYVKLAQEQQLPEQEANRGLTQAYLSLAQIAEKRKDFPAAEGWLAKIENPELMVQTQVRRASILASQGKLAEGRKLIQALPERNPGDARLKLNAEISLLRELKLYPAAYDLLAQANAKYPDDAELVYDQAMMAEKTNALGEMERLLRRVIALKPDYHNAYNALGYSFAERNMRLPEARELIKKALEYAPNDPFIRDSLGWVEFRMGNKTAALEIFEAAFKAKPDPEIAAHFGEVLWSTGQKDKARAIWREGQLLNADNETLTNTLKRLQVKL